MFLSNLTELAMREAYRRFFKVVPAMSDELRAESFRIRHEVYCRELGFEPLRADGVEVDAYDARSLHCLVQSAASGAYVGCARLICADPADPEAPFPFEVSCQHTLDHALISPILANRTRTAEVSRLAVIGAYRRRRGERDTPFSLSENDFGTTERPRHPYLALAVYLGLLALARHFDIATLFMLTEARLVKNLTRLGVRIDTIGGEVQHRGTRFPSMMSVEPTISEMNVLVRALFDIVAGEVRHGLTIAGPTAAEPKAQVPDRHRLLS